MKHKVFCILLSGILALSALSACGNTQTPQADPAAQTEMQTAAGETAAQAEVQTQADGIETAAAQTTAAAQMTAAAQTAAAQTTAAVPDNEYAADETRTLAYYTGIYGAGRCTVRVRAIDETTADISITWGSSAWETTEWKMTGYFNPDVYRLTYSDCVKTDITFAEDGTETRTVVYENGVGRFQLAPDHSMQWQDEQENAGQDMDFAYSPAP